MHAFVGANAQSLMCAGADTGSASASEVSTGTQAAPGSASPSETHPFSEDGERTGKLKSQLEDGAVSRD